MGPVSCRTTRTLDAKLGQNPGHRVKAAKAQQILHTRTGLSEN